MSSFKYYFKRYFIILFTVFTVILILCFYFFKTIKIREKELTSRGFRILKNIGKNFEDKHQGYQQTLSTYNQNSQTADSIDKYIKDIESIVGEKKESINIKDSVGVYKEKGAWYLLYKKGNYNNFISSGEEQTERKYRINFKNFVEPILNFRKDFFTNYIILYGDSIIYQSQSLAFDSEFGKLKDTINQKILLKSSFQNQINLAGVDYYVYFHPLAASSDLKKITICGLITTDKFEASKLTPGNYNFIKIVLLILLLLLLIPFIKLLTIGKFERLYKRDILFIIISIIIISILINILFINNPYNIFDWNKKETILRLKNTNQMISESFNKDVNGALDHLEYLENKFKDGDAINLLIACNDPTNSNFQKNNDALIKEINLSPSEEIIFLLNNGMIQWKWLNCNNINYTKIPNVSVSARDYYIKLEDDSINCFKANNTKFYFQPIYSWTDQKNSVVYSKILNKDLSNSFQKLSSIKKEIGKNDTLFAICTEAKPLSVMNQVLPKDIAFCIIDKTGFVLFHSDGKRNLRENFLEECNQDGLILSAINNRISKSSDIHYYGSSYVAFISPLEQYPYYVVSLCNKTMEEESKFNIIIFTLFCSFSILIIIGIILISYSLIGKRTSILKSKQSIISLIRNTSVNTKILNQIILISILSIITFIVLSIFLPNSELLITSFLLPLWLMVNISLIIFLNYKKEYYHFLPTSYQKEITKKFTTLWVIIITSMILLSIAFSQFNIFKFNLIIIGTFLCFLILPGIIIFIINYRNTKTNTAKVSHFVFRFSLMMVLLIVNTSIIPGTNFYRIGLEQESLINIKRRTLEEAKKYEEQYKEILKLNLLKESTQNLLTKLKDQSKYYDSVYINNNSNLTYKEYNNTTLTTFYALINIKYKFNKYEMAYDKLALTQNNSLDNLWNWKIDNDNHVHLTYSFNCLDEFDKNCKGDKLNIHIKSSDSIHHPFLSGNGGTFIFFIVTIIILYLIISYSYKKITLIDYFNSDYFKTWNEGRERLTDNKLLSTDNVVFVTLPGSGLEGLILTKFNEKNYEQIETEISAELIALDVNINRYKHKNRSLTQLLSPSNDESKHWAKNIYLIKNFNLNGNSDKELKIKLDFLKTITTSQENKIIWLMDTDPFIEMENLKKNLKISKDIKEEKDSIDNLLQKNFYDLLKIMNDFHKDYYPIPTEYSLYDTYFMKIINSECDHGEYLKTIKKVIPIHIKNAEIDRNVEEEIILKVQETAKNYYYSLWTCLSNEEKFVLYDMAIDGLTNYKNFQVLKLLLSKGLVIYHKEQNRLMIMNKSFRNFILTVIEPTDALELENKINVSGTWKITQTMITVLLLMIGVMIAVTQQALFNKIIGIATAVSSILPILFTTLRNLSSPTSK